MTWELQTLDAAGKPISAEASLALVDKAVLSLADDAAGSMMDRFYRERGLGVTTGATLVVNVDRLVAQLATGGKGGGGRRQWRRSHGAPRIPRHRLLECDGQDRG